MALLGTRTQQWESVTTKKAWMGQKKKHEITPPTQNYFQFLQIQPGSGFFRGLVECKYPIGGLMLNIPAVLINLGVTIMIRTSIGKRENRTQKNDRQTGKVEDH